ncbi:MAG: OST-HTH/LOTUS domain-containing protein [Bacteroidales bacterium]
MDKSQIRSEVIEAISRSADESGWANLAKIGAYLRKKEIRYGRLSRMLKEYDDVVELKIDDSIQPPIAYARIKEA